MLYLLDASAVLNEPNFEFEKRHKYITTPEILSELKTLEARTLGENALHHGILTVQSPAPEFVQRVEKLIREKGFKKVSRPDVSILALGLQFLEKHEDFEVLTDDYSIQNFLSLLGIPFSSVIQGTIRHTIVFQKICLGCGKKFPADFREEKCGFCGSKIVSRAVKEKRK